MRRITIAFVVNIASILCLCASAFAADNWPDAVDQYVMQVRKGLKTVSIDGYLDVVKKPDGALIVDVREEDELKAGLVPGAINIPRGRLEFRIWRVMGYPGKVDMDRKIYVQCSNGGRGTLGAKQLQDIGFTNVTAAVVSMAEWEKRGFPLVKAEGK